MSRRPRRNHSPPIVRLGDTALFRSDEEDVVVDIVEESRNVGLGRQELPRL